MCHALQSIDIDLNILKRLCFYGVLFILHIISKLGLFAKMINCIKIEKIAILDIERLCNYRMASVHRIPWIF